MEMKELKQDLERITGARDAAPGGTVAEALARLDAIARQPDTPERLKHYLSRRSYVKALAWIEDPSAPHQP